jgi:hypothetical protein
VRGKSRKASRPARGKGAKRLKAKPASKTRAAKPRQKSARKISRKRVQPQGAPVLETTIIDIVEEPAPGVVTVTEFEETNLVRRPGVDRAPPEED